MRKSIYKNTNSISFGSIPWLNGCVAWLLPHDHGCVILVTHMHHYKEVGRADLVLSFWCY